MKKAKSLMLALSLPLGLSMASPMYALPDRVETVSRCASPATGIVSGRIINPTTAEVLFSDHTRMCIDFYGEHIFRMFQDIKGGIIRDPEANPEAQILVDAPRRAVSPIALLDNADELVIATSRMKIVFNKQTACFKLVRLSDDAVVAESVALHPPEG